MLKFQAADGTEYQMCFYHDRKQVPANPHKAKSRPHVKPYATTCMIVRGADTVGTGAVRCHHKDQFCYRTGRKESLRRALDNAGFDRAARAAAWKAIGI